MSKEEKLALLNVLCRSFREKKEKIVEAEKIIKCHKASLKQDEDEIIRILQKFKTTSIGVEGVTFSIVVKEKCFYPSKTKPESRTKFLDFVKYHLGEDFILNHLQMAYTTVTNVYNTSLNEGWIKKEEGLPGLDDPRAVFSLRISKK